MAVHGMNWSANGQQKRGAMLTLWSGLLQILLSGLLQTLLRPKEWIANRGTSDYRFQGTIVTVAIRTISPVLSSLAHEKSSAKVDADIGNRHSRAVYENLAGTFLSVLRGSTLTFG